MRMRRWTIFLSAPLVFLAAFSACRSSDAASPAGSLRSVSGCLSSASGGAASPRATASTCLAWSHDGSTLRLAHRGACFNCCTQPLPAFTIGDGQIVITENESWGACYCLCVKDVEMEVTHLPAGRFRVTIVSGYDGSQEPLDVSIDLQAQPQGEYCVPRSGYPWETD